MNESRDLEKKRKDCALGVIQEKLMVNPSFPMA